MQTKTELLYVIYFEEYIDLHFLRFSIFLTRLQQYYQMSNQAINALFALLLADSQTNKQKQTKHRKKNTTKCRNLEVAKEDANLMVKHQHDLKQTKADTKHTHTRSSHKQARIQTQKQAPKQAPKQSQNKHKYKLNHKYKNKHNFKQKQTNKKQAQKQKQT